MKLQPKIILLFVLICLAGSILFSELVWASEPSGANVSATTSSRAPNDTAQSAFAQAGNVTELNIFGYTTTQSWQGYYGNVTGTIQLADGNDNVMYNWTSASPRGEIYASKNDSIVWLNIQCFNFTADASYAAETGNEGATSLFGKNLEQLETEFNISSDDGINETFTYMGASEGHHNFYANNYQFSDGECRSTRVYANTGKGEKDNFEEILLYEPNTTSVILATILNEDAAGFDTASHDFEMLVPENGHGTDLAMTRYYFWVELQ